MNTKQLSLSERETLILKSWISEIIKDNSKYNDIYTQLLIDKIFKFSDDFREESGRAVTQAANKLKVGYDEEKDATVSKCFVCGEEMTLKGTFEYGFYWACDHCNTRYQ